MDLAQTVTCQTRLRVEKIESSIRSVSQGITE